MPIVIRTKQMAEFGRASGEQFAREMCARVAELSPPLAAVATEAGVRRFVDRGLEAAAAFDLKNSESLRFFIETGVVLGHRFFEDPQYPWAANTLNDRPLETEDGRIEMLSRYLFDYLDEVFGPGNAYGVRTHPDLNPTYQAMAMHYGIGVVPARPYSSAQSKVLLH